MRLVSRIRALSLSHLQILAAETVFAAYFLSEWKYRLWYVAALLALGITISIAVLGGVTLRGLAGDVALLCFYFLYLYIAAGWSSYESESRFWVAADSIGIIIFALFWVASRCNEPDYVRHSFVRVTLLAAVLVFFSYFRLSEYSTRLGGYTLSYLPVVMPFIWAELIAPRTRRIWPALALIGAVMVLVMSRSRAPLAVGILILGMSIFAIGRGLRKKIKYATLILVASAIIGGLLMTYLPTRVWMLTFVARITHKDIVSGDIYIPGEPEDPTRARLFAIVSEHFRESQPFGVGYMTTGRLYERMYGEYFTLHDIYQTWLFEGGIVCVLIVLVILVRYFRALRFARRHAATMNEVTLARCIVLAMFGELLMGAFHQAHHGPVLYALLGLGFGLRARVASERRRVAVPALVPVGVGAA